MNEDSGKARMILAVVLLILTACLIAILLFRPPADDFVKTQLTLVLGVFLAKLSDLFAFYYGTSSGAKTLSAAQAEAAKAVTHIATTAAGTGNGLTGAAPTGTPGDPVSVTETVSAPAPKAAARAPSYDPGDAVPATLASVDIPFPPEPEDPRLTRFRQMMRMANERVTEKQVLAAFRVMYPDA